MWQAEEPTPMPQELRSVCGLPVETGILFTNAQGVYSSRIETCKTQLLAQMTFLRKFLEEDEHILYVATAYSPMKWHTMAAMEGVFPLVAKQAVLVFTDQRWFHVPTTRLYEYRGSVAQAWYRDCQSMRVLRRATYLTLYLQYSSGKKESFRQIASADGAKIMQLAAHVGDFASAGNTGGPSAPRERHHLCPQCTQVLTAGVWTCPACGLEFKNDREATIQTLAVPGGGFFYGRHPGLGTVVALSECVVIYAMLMGAHGLVRGVGDSADSASLLGIAGAFLAAMKLNALGAARGFVAEFLPKRLKPLLDEAKTPDGPVLPRMRDPLMRGLVASLIILLGFVAFDRWRSMGPGAAPARAVPRGELPPCYEHAQDPHPPVQQPIQAQQPPAPVVPAAPQSAEQAAIEGLHACASLSNWYPESFEARGARVDNSVRQRAEQIRSRQRNLRADGDTEQYRRDLAYAQQQEESQLDEKIARIELFMSFCRTLREEKREPVYYGQVVRPCDGTRVLLCWQLAPNEYRVIFGDLRAETVSADRLAQLEAVLSREEQNVIEGLRTCASLVGHYPESSDLHDARFAEEMRQLRENARSQAQSDRLGAAPEWVRLEGEIARITCFGDFCRTLQYEKREPVYYGQVVKPGEAERVLLRWQLAPGRYRLVFGDLHVETVTAERLAQLEADAPQVEADASIDR